MVKDCQDVIGLPSSIQSQIQASLDRLPELNSLLLQCASVLGTRFSTLHVHHLLEIATSLTVSKLEVSTILASLEKLQYISSLQGAVTGAKANDVGWEVRRHAPAPSP